MPPTSLRIPSESARYPTGTMVVYAFAALYASCAALLLAVWVQDRRRNLGRAAHQPTPDPRTTHEFVFRTQA